MLYYAVLIVLNIKNMIYLFLHSNIYLEVNIKQILLKN